MAFNRQRILQNGEQNNYQSDLRHLVVVFFALTTETKIAYTNKKSKLILNDQG